MDSPIYINALGNWLITVWILVYICSMVVTYLVAKDHHERYGWDFDFMTKADTVFALIFGPLGLLIVCITNLSTRE